MSFVFTSFSLGSASRAYCINDDESHPYLTSRPVFYVPYCFSFPLYILVIFFPPPKTSSSSYTFTRDICLVFIDVTSHFTITTTLPADRAQNIKALKKTRPVGSSTRIYSTSPNTRKIIVRNFNHLKTFLQLFISAFSDLFLITFREKA